MTEDQAFVSYGQGQYKEAYPVLAQLAKKNDVHALLAIAWMEETGAVGKPNAKLASQYYRLAVNAGSEDAINRLGRLLLAEGDTVEAKTAFELGTKKGITPCMCHLGLLMIKNADSIIEKTKGIELLKLASSRGHFFAKRKLLSMEWSETKSTFRKIDIFVRFISLTIAFLRQSIVDRNSDKLA